MSSCPESATVSSQDDVDKLNSSCYSNIVIQDGMGTLNFTTLEDTNKITAFDSPVLETLHFPRLHTLESLVITNITALTTVSIPMFSTNLVEYFSDGTFTTSNDWPFNLNVSTAPKLATLELANLTSYGNLSLFGVPPPYFGGGILGTSNISAALLVQTDSLVEFVNLKDIGELQIFAVPGHAYSFDSLRSAGNITISNANDFLWINFDSDIWPELPLIKINNSLILESSTPPDPNYSSNMKFGRISTVGDNLKISSMSNVNMDFKGITDVGGDLSLIRNTNCTWNFGQVTSAGSLTILDNDNSVVPLFSHLETIGDIHLRGNIDTYVLLIITYP